MPVFAIKPGIVFEHRPTLRTVSIIPGIDLRAPDLTEMSSGLPASPNFAPMIFSTAARAPVTSASTVLGYERPCW